MRIVFNSTFENAISTINKAADAWTEAQRQLASGQRMATPSDDPLSAASAINEHAALQRIDAYTSAGDAAAYRLGMADSALSDVVSQLTAAQSSALSARGTNVTQSQRDAASRELLSIRDALMADANTQFQGVYLFSGAKVTTAPFSLSGGTVSAYQGDSTQAQIEVQKGRSVAATFDGAQIFQGSDSQHVLDTLTDLAAAVTAGDDAAIATGVDALKRAFDRATAAQSAVGNDLDVVADSKLRMTTDRTGVIARLSSIEDADPVASAAKTAQAETAYRAALSSVATLGRVSLMDYLK